MPPSLQSRFIRYFMGRFDFFGGPQTTLTALRQRSQAFERWIPSPRAVTIQPVHAGGVSAEWAIPPGAPEGQTLLYFHGGAFVMGSKRLHRPMVTQLALASRCRALSIDYRLAPEHPFPAALEDCAAAYAWLLQQGYAPQHIVLAGDSAGGNLALALLLKLRDAGAPLPAGAVCLSPVTDLEGSRLSRRTKAAVDPILGRGLAHVGLPASYSGDYNPRHPTISPLFADLHDLPPVLIHVGEDEILLDDATEFIAAVRTAGGSAECVVWPGMWHVFQMSAPFMPEARQSLRQMGVFIRARLDSAFPEPVQK